MYRKKPKTKKQKKSVFFLQGALSLIWCVGVLFCTRTQREESNSDEQPSVDPVIEKKAQQLAAKIPTLYISKAYKA